MTVMDMSSRRHRTESQVVLCFGLVKLGVESRSMNARVVQKKKRKRIKSLRILIHSYYYFEAFYYVHIYHMPIRKLG